MMARAQQGAGGAGEAAGPAQANATSRLSSAGATRSTRGKDLTCLPVPASPMMKYSWAHGAEGYRYMELQKLLGVDNIEKAALLMQAADYTRSLQVRCALSCNYALVSTHMHDATVLCVQAAMRQLLELQGQAKLPEVHCIFQGQKPYVCRSKDPNDY